MLIGFIPDWNLDLVGFSSDIEILEVDAGHSSYNASHGMGRQ